MQIEYTQPIQITAVSKENKTVNTKFGEKEKFSFKTSDNVWYDSWSTDIKQTVQGYASSGQKVIIGYVARNWEGKEFRTEKQVIPQGDAPQQTSMNQSNGDKDESIARAVALKAAVEHCKDNDWEPVAERMLAWLKAEKPSAPATITAPMDDSINIDEIPF